jgi:hypothetical protein
MRRHFESKHAKKKLNLPEEEDRHPCSCGRTFLEPNRLQEHMVAADHTYTCGTKPPKSVKSKKIKYNDVIDWTDMID